MPPAPLSRQPLFVRAEDFVRRHPAPVLIGGIGAALLLLGLSVTVATLLMMRPAPRQAAPGPARDATGAAESPSALARAFAENQIGANDAYTGRVVEVKGCPARIGEAGGHGLVELSDHGNPFNTAGGLVACEFGPEQRDSIKDLTWQQSVTIRGTCRGIGRGRVLLSDCRVVHVEKDMPFGPRDVPEAVRPPVPNGP